MVLLLIKNELNQSGFVSPHQGSLLRPALMNPSLPRIEGHPRLSIFHELASVNKVAGVLNASLS